MTEQKSTSRVVIVGAGPVGMVCALALNQRGVPVTVFEQEPAPVKDQRAASIHPPTLGMLDQLGVTRKIDLRSRLVSRMSYRLGDTSAVRVRSCASRRADRAARCRADGSRRRAGPSPALFLARTPSPARRAG